VYSPLNEQAFLEGVNLSLHLMAGLVFREAAHL
jgi:hypothetical protein